MKLVALLVALLAGHVAAMTVPPSALDDPAVRRRLETEHCIVTFQTCVTRIVDGTHITNNCDIRVSECEEKDVHGREEVARQRRPAARVVLRGGEEPQRRLVLEA